MLNIDPSEAKNVQVVEEWVFYYLAIDLDTGVRFEGSYFV